MCNIVIHQQLFVFEQDVLHSSVNHIALGRKNWLFCGNNGAAENAAITYSMLGCCKAHGVNFRDWLVQFLNNVHNYDTDYSKDLAELLPHNFAKEVPKSAQPIRQMTDVGLSKLSEHLVETLIEKHYFSEKQYGVYRMLTVKCPVGILLKGRSEARVRTVV